MTRGARPRIFCALWAVSLTMALFAAGVAAAAATPAGRWAGEIETPDGKKAEVYLILDQKAGAWTGSLEDPVLGSAEVSNLKVTATGITFRFQPEGAPFAVNFSGSYVAGDDRVTGTFSLQGSSRFVKFKRVGAAAATADGTGAAKTTDAKTTDAKTADAKTADADRGPNDTAKIPEVRTKHPYHVAFTGRFGWWSSLHSIKDENYTMNNLTAAAPAFDGAVKWFVLDGFSVFARGVRAGQNITDDTARLAAFADNGLTADSYIKLDGVEIGVAAYVGKKLMPQSHLNPYFTMGAGRYQWALTTGHRGTTPVSIEQAPVKGTDLGGWFGIGTEYAMGSRMALDLDFAWRFFLTRDTAKWRDSEDVWGNTLAWAMSAGVTYGF